jgi:hypothetical protein
MPRLIEAPEQEAIELSELIDMLESTGFDPRDDDDFASWAPALKRLANNRTFLSDLILAELKQRCDGQLRGNQYSAQVVMLHASSEKFMMRANFWPALNDSIVRNSGPDPFFYGVPHDHNFSFLTVGYLGPGYWSDYYEYDYESVTGYPGEDVDLRFVERSRLDTGKVMLYRAHRDVHLQLPADALSISLNIMESAYNIPTRDQYRFDVENGRIDGILTRTAIEPMLALAAHFGGEDAQDLLDDFAAAHPMERIRWAALQARASALPRLDERIAVYARATANPCRLVREMARRELGRLEAGRSWIETGPPGTETTAAA